MPVSPLFVGIDVSKDHLDVYIHPTKESLRLPNSQKGFDALVDREDLLGAVIGCEATGGYEEGLLLALTEAGRPGFCLHPADIRAFARLKGRRAKTDQLDAKSIAEALESASDNRKPALRTKKQREIRELLTLRRSMMVNLYEMKALITRMACHPTRKMIKQSIAGFERRIARIDAIVEQNLLGDETAKRIQTVHGAGPQLAATIVGFLPEIGTLSSRQIASLVGVAPHPRQSGRSSPPGRCHGGRAIVRRVLYMATISIIRSKRGSLYAFYGRLREAGKPFKVAIVATMRKFIIILNSMITHQLDWDPNHTV